MMSIQQCKYLLKSWNWWIFYAIFYLVPESLFQRPNLFDRLSSPALDLWPHPSIRNCDWQVSLKIRNPAYSISNTLISLSLVCTGRTTIPLHSLHYCLCCGQIFYRCQLCAVFFLGHCSDAILQSSPWMTWIDLSWMTSNPLCYTTLLCSAIASNTDSTPQLVCLKVFPLPLFVRQTLHWLHSTLYIWISPLRPGI